MARERATLRVLVVGPKHPSANSRGGMAELIGLMRGIRDPRVRVRTIATYVDDRRALRLWVGVRGMLVASALVVSRRVDIVHVHLAHRGSVVRKSAILLTARLAGVPAVVHAHSYDFAGWFDQLSPAGARLVRRAMPAQRWYVLGDALVEQYKSRLQLPSDGTLRVLPNPVRVPETVPHRSADGVLAVCFGRMGTRKGSYDLVAALAGLDPAARRQLRVIIAGDGEVEEVRAAAAAADLGELLEIRSWVSARERDTILARAHVFVLPSYDEGLPLALLEAMAWGLAPITTPVGAIPDVVDDGVEGLLVTPGDPDQLARAIERVVLDTDLRTRLAAAARARAQEHDVDAWVQRVISGWFELDAERRR